MPWRSGSWGPRWCPSALSPPHQRSTYEQARFAPARLCGARSATEHRSALGFTRGSPGKIGSTSGGRAGVRGWRGPMATPTTIRPPPDRSPSFLRSTCASAIHATVLTACESTPESLARFITVVRRPADPIGSPASTTGSIAAARPRLAAEDDNPCDVLSRRAVNDCVCSCSCLLRLRNCGHFPHVAADPRVKRQQRTASGYDGHPQQAITGGVWGDKWLWRSGRGVEYAPHAGHTARSERGLQPRPRVATGKRQHRRRLHRSHP